MSRELSPLQVAFSEADWDRLERTWAAWWAGELPRPVVMIEGLAPTPDGIAIPDIHNLGALAASFPGSASADDVLDYYQPRLEAKRYYGDIWPRWKPTFGPGVMAGFLGAKATVMPNTVWFEPSQRVPVGEMRLCYAPDNPLWRRVQDLTQRAVDRWGNALVVAITDLGCNLDVLSALVTAGQLLLDVTDSPIEVARLAGEITSLWLRYYDELYDIVQGTGRGTTPWATIWSPRRCYMLQSDFSYMLSPRMFERFVLPDLAASCERLDHAFYHLDGSGQIRHLNALLSLERLHGIQWIPGDGAPPPEEWLPLLGRIRAAGKLCQLYVSPEGALTIARALGGRGFAFYINQPMEQDEAAGYIRLLSSC
jgi:hypothetical protein